MTDFANRESAAFAWLGLLIFVTAYWISYDLWAYFTGHRAMTTQFRMWLNETIWGPVVAAVWVGLFVGYTFHFLHKASTR